MRAYVDESGCMGMKLHRNSSKYFGVVAVLFCDPDEATRCYDGIELLKQELGITREFRFVDCCHRHKTRFLQEARSYDFSYWGLVVSKEKLASKSLRFSRPFLKYPVTGIFAQMADKMESATVVMDRTGSSEFRKSLAKDLRAN